MARELLTNLAMRDGSHARTIGRRKARSRGFTLTELMIVVAIIGVLAVLAIYSYKKFIDSSSSAEAKAIIQGIRGAEESHRAETLIYLGCSAFSDDRFFPQGKKPDDHKYGWGNQAHVDWQCWRRLNVVVDAPVRFGYTVVAGMPGTPMTAPGGFDTPPQFPNQTTEPWFVVYAAADRDLDGILARAVSSSVNGEINTEYEYE